MTQSDPEQSPYGPPPQHQQPTARYGQPPGPHQQAPVPYGASGYFPPPQETSGSAITALVLGLVSIMMGCGLFLGIPAMIVGRKSMREIDASQGRLTGRGMAQAGFWTGLAGTVLWGLFYLAYIAFFVVMIFVAESGSPTSTNV